MIQPLGTMIILTNVMPVNLVDIERFHWISEKFDLPVVLHAKSEDHASLGSGSNSDELDVIRLKFDQFKNCDTV